MRRLAMTCSALALMMPALALAQSGDRTTYGNSGSDRPAASDTQRQDRDGMRKDDTSVGEAIRDGARAVKRFGERETEALGTLLGVTEDPVITYGGYTIMSSRALSARELRDAPVYGRGDERIAHVDDIVFDRNGQATQIVVADAGFLGLAARKVAIPFSRDAIGFDRENDPTLRLSLTEDQLKTKTAFDEDSLKNDESLASEVLDQKVQLTRRGAGDDTADLHDLILDASGAARYAILEYGGFMELGEKAFAVPFREVTVAQGDAEWSVDLSPEQVKASPTFVYSVDEAGGAAGVDMPSEPKANMPRGESESSR